MADKISVIIPFYKAEKYLDRVLTSITCQTHRELEILLVDDGSEDVSSEMAAAWVKRDPRIRLFTLTDLGVSAARNTGLDAVTGDYVAFVDADDWILPNTLERQLLVMKRDNSDLVTCGFELACDDDYSEKEFRALARACVGDSHDEPSRIYTAREWVSEKVLKGSSRCWSILYKAEVLKDRRFIEGLSIGEDLLYLMEIACKGVQVSVMDARMYNYYMNPKGAMLSAFKPGYMDQLRCWQRAEEMVLERFPESTDTVRRDAFMGALLVAGKLAVTGTKAQREEYLPICQAEAKRVWELLGPAGRAGLEIGYRIKGPLFMHFPKVYAALYGSLKALRR